jgi:hypothetical protein
MILKIVVETPKWSFRKMEYNGEEYKRAFFHPFQHRLTTVLLRAQRGKMACPWT